MICLSSADGPTSFQMLRKFECLSTGIQVCADYTLNEFTLENVTIALFQANVSGHKPAFSDNSWANFKNFGMD